MDGKRGRGDSEKDVAPGGGGGDASLDRVLGELEDEVRVERAKKSIPPPLPRKAARPHTSSLPPPLPSSRPPSTLPAPPRPAALRPATESHRPGSRSVPPPPPRVSGLGRPASIPPRTGVPTAPGIAAPPIEPDSEDVTLVGPRELDARPSDMAAIDVAALREAARVQAEEWEAALAEAKSDARRGRLAYELGRLHEGPLRDLAKAWRCYEIAVRATPDHLPSLRGARRVAIAKKNHSAALPLFDAEARITADSRRKAALLYAKARLLEDALGEKDKARELYATAAELDRKDISILKALEQRDLAASDPSKLAQTLEREANAVAADPRHRAALIVERARLLEHREQRVDAALELYETALRLDPRAGGALDALERLAAAHGRHRELIRALERRAEASADPEERALALYRVGRLHLERLGNQGEAIAALERAAAERKDDPLVLEDLAILYERAERFEPLAQILTRLAVLSRDPPEQLAAWHRIGQLFDERLDAKDDARRAYEHALALDPTHVPTLIALGRLYEAAGAWDALIAMCLAEAEEARDPKRRAAAHARVAEVLELEKGQKDDAMAHHARALSLSPGYAPSEKALARLYAEAGKHRELVELHERAVEHAASTDEPASTPKRAAAPAPALSRASVSAIAHLFRIGAVQEDALGEHAQAASTYRRILALDPSNLGALHALQRATERAGRHAELVDALEREAGQHGADARVAALLTRAGEILDADLGDSDAAIARYRRVLELDPRHGPALSGLGRIFHRKGRWDDLLELYERELALDPKSAALLHKMGQLCEERIGDEARALEHYRRAVELDPSHRPSLSALARKLASQREHAELVRVLGLTLEGLKDPAARARAAFRVGEVCEQHLGAPERAMVAYESSLAAVPGFLPAAEGLARIRAAEGAWRRLVDQLEQEAARSDDPERAVRKLAQAGELWARALGDARRATAAYERALALAPRHLESLLALEKLYTSLAHRDALARTYGTLARVLADPGARVASLRELARLEQRGGGDAGELRSIHEAILGLAPDDPGALDALEALALERGDRALLAKIDARLVAKAGDARTAAAYQTRLAESLEAAADASALAAYRAALESDPESMAAARGLARVAAKLGMPEAVALAARREAAITPEPRLAARQLVRAAKVAHRELGDPRAALADYERALELSPDDADAAAGLEELLLTAGQGPRAADRLARAAAAASIPERASALWMEVARLQSDLLGNVPGALTSLARVLKSAPTHVPALRRTAELHVRQERYEEAAATLAKVVSIAPDRDVLEAAHLELARLWTEHLSDLPRALVSLQAVLALDPDHEGGLRRLAEVSERSGQTDKAADTLRRLVDRASSPAARVSALVRLSEVHEARGDRDAAERAAWEALAIEGPSGPAADRHRALVRGKIGWEAHAEALLAWLAAGAGEGAAPRDASLEIARIFREELERPASAIEVLERAARANHGDLEVRRTLASTLRLASRFEEALAELRSLIGEQPARAELWRELAHTLRASGDLAGSQRALAPLVLLGSAHGEEHREASSRAPLAAQGRPGSLDAGLLEALYPMRRAGALLTLLRHATPTLGKLYAPDFDAFGVSSRDRVSTRSSEPIRRVADRVSAIFGCGEVHVYVHRARGRGIAVELTSPPSILIPASVAELGEAQHAFAIARAAANITTGLHAVDKLTPRELEMVLAAVARRVAPGFGAGLTSEDVLEDIHKRFYRALPRRSRRDVEEAARAYVAVSERDFAAVTEAVAASAQRLALVVSDDLLASVEVLGRTERDVRELTGPRLMAHPKVSRLVRFWVSPEADALRQRMGLASSASG